MKLIAEKIEKKYPRKKKGEWIEILKQTQFVLESGKITAVTGRSGSGKSTLLYILSGLLKPSSGRVIWKDRDLYRQTDRDRAAILNSEFGIIPQGYTCLDSLTVEENIRLPLRLKEKNVARTEFEKRAGELMETLEISHLRGAYPGELSGGEKRRLAIARALAGKPQVIFADEPTGDLDEESTKKVWKLLKDEAGRGCAVLLVTHERVEGDFFDIHYHMDAGQLRPAEN